MHGLPPLLGVRIAVTDAARTLRRAAFSLTAQTHRNTANAKTTEIAESPPKIGTDESEPGEMDVRGAEQRDEQPVAGRCWNAENTDPLFRWRNDLPDRHRNKHQSDDEEEKRGRPCPGHPRKAHVRAPCDGWQRETRACSPADRGGRVDRGPRHPRRPTPREVVAVGQETGMCGAGAWRSHTRPRAKPLAM